MQASISEDTPNIGLKDFGLRVCGIKVISASLIVSSCACSFFVGQDAYHRCSDIDFAAIARMITIGTFLQLWALLSSVRLVGVRLCVRLVRALTAVTNDLETL